MKVSDKLTSNRKPRGVFWRVMVTRYSPHGAKSRSVSLMPANDDEARRSAEQVLVLLLGGLEEPRYRLKELSMEDIHGDDTDTAA